MPPDNLQHRRSRRRALQALYAWESRDATPDALIPILAEITPPGRLSPDERLRADTLLRLVVQNLARVDGLLKEHLSNWRLDRLAAIDRNVLRLGVAELLFLAEGDGGASVTAMVELAERYGSPQSPRFVHGVLDAIRRHLNPGERPATR